MSKLVSLYHIVRDQLNDRIAPILCTKATLVHLSHMFEDYILQHEQPAAVFTGFQESSHWKQETARYRQLSQITHNVFIFAGKVPPEDHPMQALQITLEEGDPLRQEWFLVILSDRFSVLLAGLDNLAPVGNEATRLFETFWTFEPDAIDIALDALLPTLQRSRPDILPRFWQARHRFPPRLPIVNVITGFLHESIRFENMLNNALSQSEARFRGFVASISDHIYVYAILDDGSTQNLFVSPNVESLIGYPPERKSDDWGFWLTLIHPDDMPNVTRQIEAIQRGENSEIEYRVRHADGHDVWVRDNVRVEAGRDDQKWVVYGVISDMTERIERQRLNEDLERERWLNDLKTNFLITVSHELRTPLAAILAARDNLERYFDRMTAEERGAKLSDIGLQIDQLRNILDDLTLIARTQMRANEVVQEVVELVAFTRGVADRVVETFDPTRTHIAIKSNVKEITILTDRRFLSYALLNLLSNAVKYTPAGRAIHVVIGHLEDGVAIRVRDQGIGISAQDLPRIFDPFYRGGNVGTMPGSGLGLKVAQDCIALLGGTITVASTIGVGTTFTIHLPANDMMTALKGLL